MSHIFPAFSRFFYTNVQISLSFPSHFDNFSNSLSFPGLWPPWFYVIENCNFNFRRFSEKANFMVYSLTKCLQKLHLQLGPSQVFIKRLKMSRVSADLVYSGHIYVAGTSGTRTCRLLDFKDVFHVA